MNNFFIIEFKFVPKVCIETEMYMRTCIRAMLPRAKTKSAKRSDFKEDDRALPL